MITDSSLEELTTLTTTSAASTSLYVFKRLVPSTLRSVFLFAICGSTDVENGHLHDLALHDSYGHFTVFGAGNKANVAGEKFSSDTYIHNELMRYLGDELKKDPV